METQDGTMMRQYTEKKEKTNFEKKNLYEPLKLKETDLVISFWFSASFSLPIADLN